MHQWKRIGGHRGWRIQLTYTTGGDEKVEIFDLVIILTQPRLSASTQRIAKQLAVHVDETDFMGSCGKTVKTDHEGILLVKGI